MVMLPELEMEPESVRPPGPVLTSDPRLRETDPSNLLSVSCVETVSFPPVGNSIFPVPEMRPTDALGAVNRIEASALTRSLCPSRAVFDEIRTFPFVTSVSSSIRMLPETKTDSVGEEPSVSRPFPVMFDSRAIEPVSAWMLTQRFRLPTSRMIHRDECLVDLSRWIAWKSPRGWIR